MFRCRSLSSKELKDLQVWMKRYNIEMGIRTRRELSNVVPVAQLFKRVHHHLVDMRNYSSRNSKALKLDNWETFNFRVLRKLHLGQTRPMLELLATGGNGAIEILLLGLMRSEQRKAAAAASKKGGLSPRLSQAKAQCVPNSVSPMLMQGTGEGARCEGGNEVPPEAITVELEELVDGQPKKVPRQMVHYKQFEQLRRECKEKDRCLDSAMQKTLYLEGVIKMKEERICELMDQLGKLSVSILSRRLDNDEEAPNNQPDESTKATQMETG